MLNFFPLLVWAMGFMALGIWSDHLRQMDGRGRYSGEDGKAFVEVYLGGCLVFLLIGTVLSV